MAFRLTHWLAAVGLCLLIVGAWRLPLDSVQPGSPVAPSDEEVRYRDLARDLREARATLDQVRRASRLPETVVPAAEQGVVVFLPPQSLVSDDERDALGARVRAQAEAFGAAGGGTVVGYGYDGATGGETGLAVSQTYRLETYLGEHEGTPYCIQVVVARPQMIASLVRHDLEGSGWSRWTHNLLGPCAFYAAHGLAGTGVQSWLEGGGLDFAFGRRGVEGPSLPPLPRRTVLGVTAAGWRGSIDVERCLTGDAETCAAIFTDPDRDRRGATPRSLTVRSPAFFSGSVRTGPFPTENWFLLSDLEREFGAEAFQGFWTSEQSVRVAFEQAFGIGVGEWLMRWLDQGPGIERASPAPSARLTLGSLLLVALMTGVASAWHARRRVT